jgi:hypothetical protein
MCFGFCCAFLLVGVRCFCCGWAWCVSTAGHSCTYTGCAFAFVWVCVRVSLGVCVCVCMCF